MDSASPRLKLPLALSGLLGILSFAAQILKARDEQTSRD